MELNQALTSLQVRLGQLRPQKINRHANQLNPAKGQSDDADDGDNREIGFFEIDRHFLFLLLCVAVY